MNRPADDHPHTTGATPARQQVAYLVNQYPKVSHSFIRREIQALERLGLTVHRFSQRGWNDALVDPEDISEQARTRYILKAGLLRIFAATCGAVMASPLRFAQAMGQAWRLSRQADRAPIFHLIYLAEACWLGAELKRRGVPHLHAHFGTNSAQIAMLAHTLGGPAFSFTVHGPEEFDKPLMLHLGEKIRHSAFVVAISSFGRSQLYRWVDVAQWPKVHTVHCGLDESFHAGASAQPCLAQRLVCIGRLCEQKGQMLLLQAMRLLRERGLSFELVLAGDGEMRGALEAQIQQLGLAQQVRITGWVSSAQVRDELLQARAMVLPSFGEGLPVVIMEAMALCRPVLTTYVAGIPELVLDRQTGWLVPAGDVQALADAMGECLGAAPQLLQDMGQVARARVLARHDANTEARKLAALFAAAAGAPLAAR